MSEAVAKNYDEFTLNLIKSLEKRPGICNIKLSEREAATKEAISSWEQKYTCTLPEDLKQFYLVTNGFLLQFSSRSSEGVIPVGRLEINPIEKLLRIGLLPGGSNEEQAVINDIDFSMLDIHEDSSNNSPTFDSKSRAFELDNCGGFGRACYVYQNTKPGLPAYEGSVWFMDRSLRWHFMTNTFVEYFRLLIVHLGLPQWQYLYTDVGLSQQAKQWFNLLCPVSLRGANAEDLIKSSDDSKSQSHLDVTKVFKGKLEKKQVKQQPQVQGTDATKKRPTLSAKNAPSQSSQSQAKSTGR